MVDSAVVPDRVESLTRTERRQRAREKRMLAPMHPTKPPIRLPSSLYMEARRLAVPQAEAVPAFVKGTGLVGMFFTRPEPVTNIPMLWWWDQENGPRRVMEVKGSRPNYPRTP